MPRNEPPSLRGRFRPEFKAMQEFFGGGTCLLSWRRTGILELVVFEFVPGVRRGLAGYGRGCSLDKRERSPRGIQ